MLARHPPRRPAIAACVAFATLIAGVPAPTRAATDAGIDAHAEPETGALRVDPGADDAVRGTMAVELGAPPGPEAARALELAASRRFAEAAAIFAAMSSDPRAHYHGALLYALAGRHALALGEFDRFLREGALSPAIREYVESLRRIEFESTAEVSIDLVERSGTSILTERRAGLRMTLTPVDPGEPIVLTTLNAPLRIDAGRWDLEVAIPGYLPARALQVAAPGPEIARWTVQLERRRVHQDLRFRPPKALRRSAQLRLTSTDLSPPQVIDRPIDDEQMTVLLPTGTWSLEASSRRYRATRTLLVRDPPSVLDVELTRAPAVEGERLVTDRKARYALLGYVGATYLTGIGLLLGANFRQAKIDTRNSDAFADAGVDLANGDPITPAALAAVEAAYPTATYHRDLRRIADLSTSGIVVAMSGASSALAIIPMVRGRKRAAVIELGVGGALLAGGAGWMVAYARMQAALLNPSDPEMRATKSEFGRLTGHRLGAGMLTGLGLGMVLWPAVILIRDRLHRR